MCKKNGHLIIIQNECEMAQFENTSVKIKRHYNNPLVKHQALDLSLSHVTVPSVKTTTVTGHFHTY